MIQYIPLGHQTMKNSGLPRTVYFQLDHQWLAKQWSTKSRILSLCLYGQAKQLSRSQYTFHLVSRNWKNNVQSRAVYFPSCYQRLSKWWSTKNKYTFHWQRYIWRNASDGNYVLTSPRCLVRGTGVCFVAGRVYNLCAIFKLWKCKCNYFYWV